MKTRREGWRAREEEKPVKSSAAGRKIIVSRDGKTRGIKDTFYARSEGWRSDRERWSTEGRGRGGSPCGEKREKEVEKKWARKRTREGPHGALFLSLSLSSNAYWTCARRLYVVKVGPCSCCKAATLVGCIISLCARDTTTLPLRFPRLPPFYRARSKDERSRAHTLPEESLLNPYRFPSERKTGISRIKSEKFCLRNRKKSESAN